MDQHRYIEKIPKNHFILKNIIKNIEGSYFYYPYKKANFNLLLNIDNYSSNLLYFKLKKEYEKYRDIKGVSTIILFIENNINSEKFIYGKWSWDYTQQYHNRYGIPVIQLFTRNSNTYKFVRKNMLSNNNFIFKSSFSIPNIELYSKKSDPYLQKMLIVPLIVKMENNNVIEKTVLGCFSNIFFRLEKLSSIICLEQKLQKLLLNSAEDIKEGFINIINFKKKKISYSEITINNNYFKRIIKELNYGKPDKKQMFCPDMKIFFTIRLNNPDISILSIPVYSKKILRIVNINSKKEYVLFVIKIDTNIFASYNISENIFNRKNWEKCYQYLIGNTNQNILYSIHELNDINISDIKYQLKTVTMQQCYTILKIPYRIIKNNWENNNKYLFILSSGNPEHYKEIFYNKTKQFVNFGISFNYKNILTSKIFIKDFNFNENKYDIQSYLNFYNKIEDKTLNANTYLNLKKKISLRM